MNSETLQRLLIDRRLNELPPDTRALLDDYLRDKPEAEEMSANIDGVIDLAQRAVTTPTPARILPLNPATLAMTRRLRGGAGTWLRRLAMAASIALAFWMGGLVGPRAAPRAVSRSHLQVADNDFGKTTGEFWSLARLKDRAERHEMSQGHTVLWSSPLAKPQLGEKL